MTLVIISCLLCLATGVVIGYFIAQSNHVESVNLPQNKKELPTPPKFKLSPNIITAEEEIYTAASILYNEDESIRLINIFFPAGGPWTFRNVNGVFIDAHENFKLIFIDDDSVSKGDLITNIPNKRGINDTEEKWYESRIFKDKPKPIITMPITDRVINS
jgi:hypothetical protein